jgi:hypothetical protein
MKQNYARETAAQPEKEGFLNATGPFLSQAQPERLDGGKNFPIEIA